MTVRETIDKECRESNVKGGRKKTLEVSKRKKEKPRINFSGSDRGKQEPVLSWKLYRNSFCLQRPGLREVTYHHKSFLIYQFKGKCDICYIRHTTQRLKIELSNSCILPSYNQNITCQLDQSNTDSAITQHQLTNLNCAKSFKISMFSIIDCASTIF